MKYSVLLAAVLMIFSLPVHAMNQSKDSKSKRKIKTFAMVSKKFFSDNDISDNDILALGGLLRDKREDVDRAPILGRVPIIGWLSPSDCRYRICHCVRCDVGEFEKCRNPEGCRCKKCRFPTKLNIKLFEEKDNHILDRDNCLVEDSELKDLKKQKKSSTEIIIKTNEKEDNNSSDEDLFSLEDVD